MPSARRVARRSVALVARQGLSRSQAAEVVMHLCDDVATRLYRAKADPDLRWLAAVRAEARQLWQPEASHIYWLNCPSLVTHAPHEWWPHPNRRATCSGTGAY